MVKLTKVCWVACVGVSLLFVSACEEQPPAPRLKRPAEIVSKSISKPKMPVTQAPAPRNAEVTQTPVSELKPALDPVKVSQAGEDIAGSVGLEKTGIFTPMAKYDSKDRVDPFIPLIAEKDTSAGSGFPDNLKPDRPLTPLETLELSQVKLVAVVEMQGRTIAMVEDAGGKGYEVTVGTYIGPKGGRVASITMEGIKIEEKVKDYQGKISKRYEEIKFHKSENGE
ncbi:pilus assembly protein PilP [uncultured Desulfobacter sp.]|uniref:pilus assembly protein PilP n=1 Tax=uncultured Desulfobacter sp. TaxID=240139 RepID=UPI002AAC0FF9|nr:pilus assembly protein PilP [uncultured Desulfobacter sp.]